MITNNRTRDNARDDWTLRKHYVFCTQLGHCPSFILATGERIIEGRNAASYLTLADNSCFEMRNVTGKSHGFHEIPKEFPILRLYLLQSATGSAVHRVRTYRVSKSFYTEKFLPLI